MLNRINRISILTLCVLVFAAQTLRADVTGSVLGVVHDSSGAVVSGAKIVVTNVQTNFKQETVSGSDGAFRILALPAGIYTLTVTATGFQTFSETDIEVKVNDQLHYDVTLKVGSVSDQVEIVANAVQVQTESTQLGDVIDSKKDAGACRSTAAASSTFWACRPVSRLAPPKRSNRTARCPAF